MIDFTFSFIELHDRFLHFLFRRPIVCVCLWRLGEKFYQFLPVARYARRLGFPHDVITKKCRIFHTDKAAVFLFRCSSLVADDPCPRLYRTNSTPARCTKQKPGGTLSFCDLLWIIHDGRVLLIKGKIVRFLLRK